jgi:threonine synthase
MPADFLPQIVYYYAAYLEMVANKTIQLGDKIDVVVPTGNFGDIFAGYLAKRMSLPIRKLIVASNENKVLTDFFRTGTYSIRRDFQEDEFTFHGYPDFLQLGKTPLSFLPG